jgi:anaerobic magnesium-protoporphyrin IX monomethyl ester cyclase
MTTGIDCFLIGHNEMRFRDYEEVVRKSGEDSGAYRYINTSFIRHRNRILNTAEVFNHLYRKSVDPLHPSDNFSLTISYLGTYLHKAGFTFDYINDFQTDKEKLIQKLEQEEIRLIGIITTFYVTYMPILEIMKVIRTYNPTVKVVVGGPFIYNQVKMSEPEQLEYMFKTIGADIYVNSAQGETTLTRILKAIKHKKPLNRIPNIYFKEKPGGGTYVQTPIEKEKNKLPENMVDWTLFTGSIRQNLAIRTSISCPFSCTFCSYTEKAGEYQTLNADTLEKELNQVKQNFNVKNIHFVDDTFNIPPPRFKKILKMMVKNEYGFKWHSFFRCQFTDEEVVKLMKESGCEGVFLGLESGNNQVLKNMNKEVTVEQYRQGIELLKKNDILVFGSFIIGFPGETEDTVQESIDLIEETGIDFYRAYVWYCDPITQVYRDKETFNIQGSQFEWSHSTMDWKTAYALRDDMYLRIQDSLCVPGLNFDFTDIYHLLNKGMKLEEVKYFLKIFHQGMQEKIRNPYQKEVSQEIIRKLKNPPFSTGQELEQEQKQAKIRKSTGKKNLFDVDF